MMKYNLALYIQSLFLAMPIYVNAQRIDGDELFSSELIEMASPIDNALNSKVDLKTLNAPTKSIDINELIGGGDGVLVPNSDGVICLNYTHLEHLGDNIDQFIHLESTSTGYF